MYMFVQHPHPTLRSMGSQPMQAIHNTTTGSSGVRAYKHAFVHLLQPKQLATVHALHRHAYNKPKGCSACVCICSVWWLRDTDPRLKIVLGSEFVSVQERAEPWVMVEEEESKEVECRGSPSTVPEGK